MANAANKIPRSTSFCPTGHLYFTRTSFSLGDLEAANAWNLELNGRSSQLRDRRGIHQRGVIAACQFMNLVMNAIDVLCR